MHPHNPVPSLFLSNATSSTNSQLTQLRCLSQPASNLIFPNPHVTYPVVQNPQMQQLHISVLIHISTRKTTTHTTMIFQLSEESRERISKVLDLGRVALHYGWIPLVIYVGEYECYTDRRCDTDTRCDTKPSRIASVTDDRCLLVTNYVSTIQITNNRMGPHSSPTRTCQVSMKMLIALQRWCNDGAMMAQQMDGTADGACSRNGRLEFSCGYDGWIDDN